MFSTTLPFLCILYCCRNSILSFLSPISILLIFERVFYAPTLSKTATGRGLGYDSPLKQALYHKMYQRRSEYRTDEGRWGQTNRPLPLPNEVAGSIIGSMGGKAQVANLILGAMGGVAGLMDRLILSMGGREAMLDLLCTRLLEEGHRLYPVYIGLDAETASTLRKMRPVHLSQVMKQGGPGWDKIETARIKDDETRSFYILLHERREKTSCSAKRGCLILHYRMHGC